jgi:multiple sugar transport system permease protein
MSDPVFRDSESDLAFKASRYGGKALIYVLLITWTIVCLFPIYWTITTSFKIAPNVMQGALIPWIDYTPAWLGWRSLGLSPDTIGAASTVRDEFVKRFLNSAVTALSSSTIAVVIGSLAAYGLSRFSYRFTFMRNADISFFFLYTLTVLPIVIWIMRDQFESIPTELEEAALVDGLSIWGAFFQIILPIALPGMVAAFILSLVLTWNEYFFAALLTSTHANTLPVMVASQTGSQGINWWAMAALSFAAILPLIIIGIALERYLIKGMTAGAVK